MAARPSLPRPMGGYLLLRQLRSGSMAELYLAAPQNAPPGTSPVVVKTLLPHLADDRRARAMFESEARITVLTDHPNLIRGLHHGVADGRPLLVLEHLAGPNLEAALERCQAATRAMPVAVARQVALGLCAGLHHLHELSDQGRPLRVVHRDVSPANVVLTRDGAVKLLDFGLARTELAADAAEPGALLGSVAYVAPEQLEGHAVDRRADVFSVGVLLHELLTGERLFWRGSVPATVVAVSEAVAPSVRERRAEVSTAVDEVVQRALARRPEERFATAAALGEAIAVALPDDEADLVGFLQALQP